MKKFNKVIVANTGDDSLTIVNLNKNFETECTKIPALDAVDYIGPYQLTTGGEEGKLYLVNSYCDMVFKFNIDTKVVEDMVIVGSFPTSIKYFNGMFIVSNSDSNSISIIDENSFKLIENVSVGERPCDIEIDSQYEKIFVANCNDYSISIIDLKNANDDQIKLDKTPIKLHIESGYIYILSYVNNGLLNTSNITTLSLDNMNVIQSIDLNGLYNNMVKIRNKETILFSNCEDGCIYEFNTKLEKVTKKIFSGGMPSNMLLKGENILFISNILDNSVLIIDIENEKVIKNIKVGLEPNGLILI